MRPIAHTIVSPANTAELIVKWFGVWTPVHGMDLIWTVHYNEGLNLPPREGALFFGGGSRRDFSLTYWSSVPIRRPLTQSGATLKFSPWKTRPFCDAAKRQNLWLLVVILTTLWSGLCSWFVVCVSVCSGNNFFYNSQPRYSAWRFTWPSLRQVHRSRS